MNIKINGEAHQTHAENLHILLAQLGHADAVVATALNGEFIAEALRHSTKINEADQIEILAPMQGG